jgi:hypothetical protein
MGALSPDLKLLLRLELKGEGGLVLAPSLQTQGAAKIKEKSRCKDGSDAARKCSV